MMKNGGLVIIELKKAFNMTLLYQAIERQKLTSQVYVGVLRPKKVWEDSYRIKTAEEIEEFMRSR